MAILAAGEGARREEGGIQGDLFDSPLRSRMKSERNIMSFPFFHLSKTGNSGKPLKYEDGQVSIEVFGTKFGIATVYDKDLILYIASLMMQALNRGETPDREFKFTAHDFLTVCGRDTSARSYSAVKQMLARLQGTQILTNIETGGRGEDGMFHWLDTAKMEYNRSSEGKRVLSSVRVRLCDWLYRAILDRNVFTVHDDYFDLPPVLRRIYDIARCHCGRQPSFQIGIEKLQARVGSSDELRNFKRVLDELVEADGLPEYRVTLLSNPASSFGKALARDGYRRGGRPSVRNIVVHFAPKGPGGYRSIAQRGVFDVDDEGESVSADRSSVVRS